MFHGCSENVSTSETCLITLDEVEIDLYYDLAGKFTNKILINTETNEFSFGEKRYNPITIEERFYLFFERIKLKYLFNKKFYYLFYKISDDHPILKPGDIILEVDKCTDMLITDTGSNLRKLNKLDYFLFFYQLPFERPDFTRVVIKRENKITVITRESLE